jgi:hypothetical protein
VTRFKELKRIENALQYRDQADLRWALGYCKMRMEIAPRKEHRKHWSKIEQKVHQALGSK